MVVTAPAGMHKITSYPLDMTNRFVSLSLLLDKLRLIALKKPTASWHFDKVVSD